MDIYIRADYTLNKIALSDIVYIEGLDDYIKVHTKNAKPLVARMTIKSLLGKLPAADFIRVH
ncbi:MAG: LytTR family DNA-binding domain-containing protein [Chryseolinea sp.]